tara:strand:+ start:4008 stop:4190 length:183 start_codon:yes stop_codon:yes gene_type:complete
MVDPPNQSADLKARWDAAFSRDSQSPRMSRDRRFSDGDLANPGKAGGGGRGLQPARRSGH